MRTPIVVFATVALSVVISQGTAAHQAGDIVIRAGAATVIQMRIAAKLA